jgi:hypothetical protein
VGGGFLQFVEVLKSVAFNFRWIESIKDIKYLQNQEYLASIPPVRKYKGPSEQQDAERFVKMSLKVVFQIQRILT